MRFAGFILLAVPALFSAAHAGPPCQSDAAGTSVRITHVIDGDTVVLDDDRHLRLIGVDTPEIGYRGRESQAGAIAARDFLRALLVPGRRYFLNPGLEKYDRHGRLLGHLFLADGTNVQASLLANGLATPLNIPPNLHFSECYNQQAELAMASKLGLWRLPQYQPGPLESLHASDRGYRILHGRITRVGKSATSTWFNFDQHLAVRILHKDLVHFPGLRPDDMKGRYVQVRGRLYTRKKQQRIQLRHGSDMKLLTHAP